MSVSTFDDRSTTGRVAGRPGLRTAPETAAPALLLAALLLAALLLAAPAAAERPQGLPAAAEEAAATAITADTLEGPIRFLSADLLRGRGPATEGDRLTQEYLASTMQLLGLQPAGEDGTWYQPFDIVGITAEVPKEWTFRHGGEALTLDWWEDFIASSGVQRPTAAIEDAELVFVGYGIQAPEHDWDDFGDADLEGKVLVILNNDPDWDPELFEGDRRLYYGRWTYKYESAARQGAVGAVIIHTDPSAGYGWNVVQTSWSGEQFELPAGDEPRLEIAAWTTEEATKRLFGMAGKDYDALVESAKSRDFTPVPLGITTSLALTNTLNRARTANVAGMIPGSDPELADQVVVFTAHHDHLGLAPEGDDPEADRIYNGALDNASGMAQLLAIARAVDHLPEPPGRSLLFLFVGAEEQGLLGSKYYAAHPTVAPGRIAANLNFDGGNIWGRTRDLTLIGMGKSDLDEVAVAVAAMQGREVYPDQFPDKGYYYRSDQFSFAQIGVPALYFDTGTDFVEHEGDWGRQQMEAWTAEHYHQPSDELTADWDFSGMVEDARLGFYAGLVIANRPTLPGWVPGDEFEAARKEALAALEDGDGEAGGK